MLPLALLLSTVEGGVDTSASALAAATEEVIIGTSANRYWSQMPSDPSSYCVAPGTKLIFKYNVYHNVYLMAGEDEFDGDDVSGGDDDDAGEGGDDEERAAAAAAAASRGEQGGANMFGFARAFSNLVGDAADGEGAGDVLPKTKKQRRQEAEARREKKVKAAEKKRKLELREKGHVVPIKGVADPSSDQLERKLLQTATRGVVRLFNAVSQAQRAAAEKKAEGGSAKKKDMSKAEFLAQLRASALGKATPAHLLGVDAEQNKEESKGGKWDVLTDGYLMGRNKMKDWDKGTREDGAKEVEYEDEDEF